MRYMPSINALLIHTNYTKLNKAFQRLLTSSRSKPTSICNKFLMPEILNNTSYAHKRFYTSMCNAYIWPKQNGKTRCANAFLINAVHTSATSRLYIANIIQHQKHTIQIISRNCKFIAT